MTGPLYLSRACLKRDPPISALAPLLLGNTDGGEPIGLPGHHLVWSLFADGRDRRRDFLWREMRTGVFLVLSARRPQDPHGLFDIADPKPFRPALAIGDRLSFTLRANPVVRRRDGSRRRSTKHDVVMDALRARPPGERASSRFDLVREEGFAWLERQAGKAGFSVRGGGVQVEGYEQQRVVRRGTAPMAFSTLEFTGSLTVSDPGTFLSAVARGFGAAKAYGCGLMLIRRG